MNEFRNPKIEFSTLGFFHTTMIKIYYHNIILSIHKIGVNSLTLHKKATNINSNHKRNTSIGTSR